MRFMFRNEIIGQEAMPFDKCILIRVAEISSRSQLFYKNKGIYFLVSKINEMVSKKI
jgi:hypothetical protein